ncbi:MAG TPA: 30S ribosome-binding factor RbfA [Deltaproteobacteria bacterium]|nr:30S ribosome-binding factor RbfA [Deltaproteobacteria bacterium]
MRYRRQRMQDLFREEISEIIQREIRDPGLGFITILDVKLSEDLKYAKILYSVYGSDEEKQKTVEALKRARGYIKHLLGKRVQLRLMPEITWEIDTQQDKIDKIEKILEDLSHAPEG